MIDRLERFATWLDELSQSMGEASLQRAVITALILTVFYAAIALVLRFIFRRLERRVERWRGTYLRPIRFQNQEIFSADETTRIALGAIRLFAVLTYVLLGYVYVSSVLSRFPPTRFLADLTITYLIDAIQAIGSAVIGYLPDLAFLIVLFFAGRYTIRLVGIVFTGIRLGRIRIANFDSEWAAPTYKLARLLIIAFFAVVAFPYLPGSASPAFQAVSIFFGVLVSLGSSGAVSDMISGTVLTYTRAFGIGDHVRIADAQGDILQKGLFVTHLRTVKNVHITIPNSLVLSNPIVNFSAEARQAGVVLHTTVTIGYEVPAEQVERLLCDAARETEGVMAAPEPFVLQTALGDFYVHYELNAYTREANQMASIYSTLHRHILDRFHAAGVEIASPHLSAVRDGNRTQIPDDYLPKNYEPASFRFIGLRPGRVGSVRDD